jgi:YHS domain-containing protein
MNLKKLSLEDAVLEVNPELIFNKNKFYKGEYKTITGIKRDNPELMELFSSKYLSKMGEENIITSEKDGEKTLYSLSSISEYNYYYRLFKEFYLTLAEALISLGYQKTNTYQYANIERFLYMKEQGFMNVICLDHKIGPHQYFVSKKEVERFKENYISFTEAADEAGKSIATIKFWMSKEYKKPIVYLNKKNVNLFYILRTDWIDFYQNKIKTKYISMDSAAKELGISTNNLEKVAKEYKIKFFQEQKEQLTYIQFLKEDIEFLKKAQAKLWRSTLDKYYTRDETMEVLGVTGSGTLGSQPYKDIITSIFVPPLICTIKEDISFRKGREKIYLKKDVDTFFEQKKKINVVNEILSTMDSNPYNSVFTSLQEENLFFSENGKITEIYWKKFLKNKTSATRASDSTIRKEIRVNYNTSKMLIQLTATKEIFMYSTKELKAAIFNSNIQSSVQTKAYQFLKKIAASRKKQSEVVNYDPASLPNIYLRNKQKQSDKSIYSINEFINLIDYVKDVENHKQKAIASIQQCFNKQTHYNYDSSWLYVLLHLNNAWRHSDVTKFPRINLDATTLDKLDSKSALSWLENYQLNAKDINEIINQVSAIKFTHSKTKKRRYFFCSDELKSAFAHSTVLCELRCRINTPYSDTLINFDNRAGNFKEIFKKEFFADFDLDFNFKSKQMNRTLISYIYSVITKMTNRNPLEVTKYIRSHSSIETTNIYIDIPQEQLDFITNQLFHMGHFGYVYDVLGELLLDNALTDREEKTKHSLILKEVFGDVHQIEYFSNYLKRLIEEQNSVKSVLLGYSVEDREQLSNLIKLGQQPAKKEGYQCIYSKCPYPSRDCEKCPFVISHFYCLSQLSEDFDKIYKEFKTKLPNTTIKGEQIRLANILYSYVHLITLAKKRFGEESITSFFSRDLEEIREQINELPSQIHLVTIPHLRKENK